MALNREGFKDKLEEYLGGARREFYKARLATKNGEFHWADHWMPAMNHWMRATSTLIDSALEVFTERPIRGFKSRDLAFEEVLAALAARDSTTRVRATNAVLRDYEIPRLKFQLSDKDTAAFWQLVATIAESSPGKTPKALLPRKRP